MKAPKQRTAILAAALAALVSGGVALQALADTPLGMRDSGQANYGAGVGSSGALAALETLDLGGLAAMEPNLSRLASAYDSGAAARAAFAAPGAANARLTAMRASSGDQSLFASESGLVSLDLGRMAAAMAAGDRRVSFAQPVGLDQVRAAMRSEGAANVGASSPIEVALTSGAVSLDTAGLGRAFAAQTSEAGVQIEAARSDPNDASLFANVTARPGPAQDLASLGTALASDVVGGPVADQASALSGARGAMLADESASSVGLVAQSAGISSHLDAMRTGGLLSAAGASFASQATESSTLDVETVAAAISGGDSLVQESVAAPALSSDSLQAAMRAGGEGSDAFVSNVTSSTPQSVDFAAVGAALAGE